MNLVRNRLVDYIYIIPIYIYIYIYIYILPGRVVFIPNLEAVILWLSESFVLYATFPVSMLGIRSSPLEKPY